MATKTTISPELAKRIRTNAMRDALEDLDRAVMATPTGDARNYLTDAVLMVMRAQRVDQASPTEQEG